jgi:hypothetical protein
MGWTQRQARLSEPPTSRSEVLASCFMHEPSRYRLDCRVASAGRSPVLILVWQAPPGEHHPIQHQPHDHRTLQGSSDSAVRCLWLHCDAIAAIGD